MDTNPISIQGLALNPKGDGRNQQGDPGQRQASRHPAAEVENESSQPEPTGDDAIRAIAEKLGNTLGQYQLEHHFDLSA